MKKWKYRNGNTELLRTIRNQNTEALKMEETQECKYRRMLGAAQVTKITGMVSGLPDWQRNFLKRELKVYSNTWRTELAKLGSRTSSLLKKLETLETKIERGTERYFKLKEKAVKAKVQRTHIQHTEPAKKSKYYEGLGKPGYMELKAKAEADKLKLQVVQNKSKAAKREIKPELKDKFRKIEPLMPMA